MRSIILSVCLIAIFLYSSTALCQYNNLEFVENKGQWDSRVRFRGDFTTGAFFLTEKGFKVFQNNPEDLLAVSDYYHGIRPAKKINQKAVLPPSENKLIVRSHTYEVQFVNALKPQIVADKPIDTYNNYFIGNDPAKWKGNCRIFQGITYKNLYPGIDARYYTNEGRLKYDLIL